jgi:hypothetical protein
MGDVEVGRVWCLRSNGRMWIHNEERIESGIKGCDMLVYVVVVGTFVVMKGALMVMVMVRNS